MFCGKCGSEIGSGASYCPNCGAKLNAPTYAPTQTSAPTQTYVPNTQEENNIAIVGFIFSFFIALVGLICSIIGCQNASRGAKHYGLAVAGVVLSVIDLVFSAIVISVYLAY